MTAALLVGAGFVLGGRTGRVAHGAAIAMSLGPAGATLIAIGGLVGRRLVDLRRRRLAVAESWRRLSELADLVGLALAAGHNVPGAVSAARRHVDREVGCELDQVLRFARHRGVAEALAASTGRGAELYHVMARSVVTGSSTLDAVTLFAERQRAVAHGAAIERARRLPVKLLFPLALLVLPGFTLVLLGPAVAGALDRLGL